MRDLQDTCSVVLPNLGNPATLEAHARDSLLVAPQLERHNPFSRFDSALPAEYVAVRKRVVALAWGIAASLGAEL